MSSIDNILLLIEHSPDKMIEGISSRVRQQRLAKKLTQAELARRSGIPLPTYRRFERKGEISLRSLVMIAIALGETADFNQLFSTEKYSSIDDILNKNTQRKRGLRVKPATAKAGNG